MEASPEGLEALSPEGLEALSPEGLEALSPEGLETLRSFQYPHGHSPSNSNSRRVYGLRPRAFWFLCIILVLVIGGAVGVCVRGAFLASENTSSGYVDSFSIL
jgi:hypothetical protein